MKLDQALTIQEAYLLLLGIIQRLISSLIFFIFKKRFEVAPMTKNIQVSFRSSQKASLITVDIRAQKISQFLNEFSVPLKTGINTVFSNYQFIVLRSLVV